MKHLRKLAAPAAGAILIAALLGVPSPAIAAPGEPCDGNASCTDRYNVTGAPEFWTVPNGVTSIELRVAAGSGSKRAHLIGGVGGSVRGTVPVHPGDRLMLAVGGEGEAPGGGAEFGGGAKPPFEPAGYPILSGSHGGGGSFVFSDSTGAWGPLLIAGGGGGAPTPPEESTTGRFGGAGGFSGSGPDAAAASVTLDHAAGGTTLGAGYAGGVVASFDGSTFTPGRGQAGGGETLLSTPGSGGGGYYGGAAGTGTTGGGGGSGYAAGTVTDLEEEPNVGDGYIEVSYRNTNSHAVLSTNTSDPKAGSPITLSGTVGQFAGAGGSGTLTFTASLGGEQKFSRSLPVTVGSDSGSGSLRGTVETTFMPEIGGDYTFSLVFTSGSTDYLDALAADVALTVAVAPLAPATKAAELAETGASGSGAAAFGALGAVLLGAGAILYPLRRRTRQ